MSILNIFSKRQRQLRGEVPDVYQFDSLPEPLRVQIVHILRDAFGHDSYSGNNFSQRAYRKLHDLLTRERGVFRLGQNNDPQDNVFEYILNEKNVEHVLDCVEVALKLISQYGNDNAYTFHSSPKQTPQEAIDELNARFREHGVGYQFDSGEIIREDSTYIHAEAVKPTLAVLRDKIYRGAEKEFLTAHEHYRHGRYEEAITDCLKAFESVMKSICTERSWTFKESDTAKSLLDVCFREELIPTYLQSEFSSLRGLLESGVPTVRNKQGGHGSGPTPRIIPIHLAGYVLHLTAANILFLAEAERAL